MNSPRAQLEAALEMQLRKLLASSKQLARAAMGQQHSLFMRRSIASLSPSCCLSRVTPHLTSMVELSRRVPSLCAPAPFSSHSDPSRNPSTHRRLPSTARCASERAARTRAEVDASAHRAADASSSERSFGRFLQMMRPPPRAVPYYTSHRSGFDALAADGFDSWLGLAAGLGPGACQRDLRRR